MDKQYSVEFFTSFVENLQNLCRNYLAFSQFVEVSGYVCVNIDSKKTERYVLCELLQCVGSVVSESYCTKAFTVSKNLGEGLIQKSVNPPGTKRRNPVLLGDSGPNLAQGPPHKQKNKHGSHSVCENEDVIRQKQTDADQNPSSNLFNTRHVQRKQPVQRLSDRSRPIETSSHTSRPLQTQSLESNLMYDRLEGETDNHRNLKQNSSLGQQFKDENGPSAGHESWMWDSTCSSSDAGVKLVVENFEERGVTLPDSMMNRELENSQIGHKALSEDVFAVPGSGAKSSDISEEDSTVEDIIDLDLMDDELESSFQADDTLELEPRSSTAPNIPNSAELKLDSNSVRKMSVGSIMVMKSAIRQFLRYHTDKSGQEIDLFSTSPEQLNNLLLEFYQRGRTLTGKELTAGSLKNVQIYVDKYLREGGYPYSISKDDQFSVCRNFIKTKVNVNSKFVNVQKYIPVDDEDIEVLYASGQLGAHSLDSIVNTLWFLNAKFFAIKGPTEHSNLKWGDVRLSPCEEYVERVPKGYAQFSLKVFANHSNPDRCLVNVYKVYRSMRPKLMMEADSPFYLKPNRQTWNEGVSFRPESLPWSTMTCLWRRMLLGARLPVSKKIF